MKHHESGSRPSLATLAAQAGSAAARPVESWNPPDCGPIDMRIARDGRWFHEGRLIARPALVALFASILRREADGHHYLVTPVEKMRITVEDAPFLAVELQREGEGANQVIGFRTTLGDWAVAGPERPIRFAIEAGTGGLKPYVALGRGLEALVSRALVFDLMDLAEERGAALGIMSGGTFFPIPKV